MLPRLSKSQTNTMEMNINLELDLNRILGRQKLGFYLSQRYIQDLAGTPESHSRSPRACAAADDNRQAVHHLATLRQGVDAAHQIAERPELASVGVTAQHQAYAGLRGSFGLPGRVRKQHGRPR